VATLLPSSRGEVFIPSCRFSDKARAELSGRFDNVARFAARSFIHNSSYLQLIYLPTPTPTQPSLAVYARIFFLFNL